MTAIHSVYAETTVEADSEMKATREAVKRWFSEWDADPTSIECQVVEVSHSMAADVAAGTDDRAR